VNLIGIESLMLAIKSLIQTNKPSKALFVTMSELIDWNLEKVFEGVLDEDSKITKTQSNKIKNMIVDSTVRAYRINKTIAYKDPLNRMLNIELAVTNMIKLYIVRNKATSSINKAVKAGKPLSVYSGTRGLHTLPTENRKSEDVYDQMVKIGLIHPHSKLSFPNI
jgi:hypothetical protein